MQAEAAEQFLAVMRRYLESLCSDLMSHTITNVQSNNDRVRSLTLHFNACNSHTFNLYYVCIWNNSVLPFQVSMLLKDSFIDSFADRDQPFVKVQHLMLSLSLSLIKVYMFIFTEFT